MSSTGLEVFDTTLQKTHTLIQDVMSRLDVRDKHRGYLALRVGLHALRDRLPIEEVAQLGAQLPMLVRGFYYEGWNPTGKPMKLGKCEFLSRIDQEFNTDEKIDPEMIARAVFSALGAHIAAGELEDIKRTLPSDLQELWTESSSALAHHP